MKRQSVVWLAAGGAVALLALTFNRSETRSAQPKMPKVPSASLAQYVEKYLPIARQVEHQTGVPAALALAQSALESRRGESYLSSKYFNFFGVKAGKNWPGALAPLKTREVDRAGNDYTVTQNFRAYPDALTGWMDWSTVAKRIANKPTSSDAEVWARALARGGYATDPQYEKILVSTIKQVNQLLQPAVSGAADVGAQDLADIRRALCG